MAMGAVRALFPWPFIGVVVLLVVLIFLTPNLLSGASPVAGSLETQAELTVDRPPTGNLTHFYVQGLGSVRYLEIRASIASNLAWPAPSSLANVTWRNVTDQTEVLAVAFATSADPVGVNVTATYVDAAGVTVVYYGLYEFDLAGGTLQTATLLPGLAGLPTTPLDALPVTLLLDASAPGSVP